MTQEKPEEYKAAPVLTEDNGNLGSSGDSVSSEEYRALSYRCSRIEEMLKSHDIAICQLEDFRDALKRAGLDVSKFQK